MNIRRAIDKDIPKVMDLLSQVLELHAAIRPDIFIPGTTKYPAEELSAMFRNENAPVFVAVDEADEVIGYVFCELRKRPFTTNMIQFTSLFIDDLCVDASQRGKHIGEALFRFACEEAKRRGCYEVTLNVWEGNDGARRFYERLGMKPKETQMEYILP
ncbi:MAG: GNAT family N-acetyltransferase [Firmicutes bacterium]|nr:GNAT family N-acetyltransferase [Bacillota bacterium]